MYVQAGATEVSPYALLYGGPILPQGVADRRGPNITTYHTTQHGCEKVVPIEIPEILQAVCFCTAVEVSVTISTLYGGADGASRGAADGEYEMFESFMILRRAYECAVEPGEHHIGEGRCLDATAIRVDQEDGVVVGTIEDLILTLEEPAFKIVIEGKGDERPVELRVGEAAAAGYSVGILVDDTHRMKVVGDADSQDEPNGQYKEYQIDLQPEAEAYQQREEDDVKDDAGEQNREGKIVTVQL